MKGKCALKDKILFSNLVSGSDNCISLDHMNIVQVDE